MRCPCLPDSFRLAQHVQSSANMSCLYNTSSHLVNEDLFHPPSSTIFLTCRHQSTSAARCLAKVTDTVGDSQTPTLELLTHRPAQSILNCPGLSGFPNQRRLSGEDINTVKTSPVQQAGVSPWLPIKMCRYQLQDALDRMGTI